MNLEIATRGTNHLVGDGLLAPNLLYGLISVLQLDKFWFETTFQNEKPWVCHGNKLYLRRHFDTISTFLKRHITIKYPTDKGKNKFSGFYLLSDQARNFVWTFHVKKMSEFFDAFNTFMSAFQRTIHELDTEVKILWSDHDNVILDKKLSRHLADKYNIRHTYSSGKWSSWTGHVKTDI